MPLVTSPAEREIREAVVDLLHREAPGHRVVHELDCGSCRADLALVGRDRLVLFEVKSARDTLGRAEKQMRTFTSAAHAAVLVAHERWFDRSPYANGSPRMSWPHQAPGGHSVWAYPEPDPALGMPFSFYRWVLPRPTLRQPRAGDLLGLLGRAEMLEECARHGIDLGGRPNMSTLVGRMAWGMTGRQVAEAVCRQLRTRRFPEADLPDIACDLTAG